jgi:hypothetical protein
VLSFAGFTRLAQKYKTGSCLVGGVCSDARELATAADVALLVQKALALLAVLDYRLVQKYKYWSWTSSGACANNTGPLRGHVL